MVGREVGMTMMMTMALAMVDTADMGPHKVVLEMTMMMMMMVSFSSRLQQKVLNLLNDFFRFGL
jgi:hypothetical protein